MEKYFRRDIDKELLEWKNSKKHKALEIIGARQVGKTTSILHFVNNNYKNVIYINICESDGKYFKEYVKKSNKKPKDLLLDYFKEQNIKYTDDINTVIVLDEIQDSEDVWELIRPINNYLHCDLIVTGSLLAITQEWFYPAGNMIKKTMHTLSFSEFIDCFDKREFYESDQIYGMSQNDRNWFYKAFKIYCVIGGYPNVVKAFMNNENIEEEFESVIDVITLEIKNVLEPVAMRKRIDTLLDSVIELSLFEKKGDKNLLEHLNNKIKSKKPELKTTKDKVYELVNWLIECDVLSYCDNYNLVNDSVGSTQRLFFNDVGLLNYLLKINGYLDGNAIGLLMEHFVYKSFLNKQTYARIYFGIYNDYEYDFVISSVNEIKIIEVKNSSERSKSIEKLIKEGKDYFFYFYFNNTRVQQDGKIKYLPIYLADKTILDDLSIQEEDEISVDYLLKDLNLF